jgi:hypothetical protein
LAGPQIDYQGRTVDLSSDVRIFALFTFNISRIMITSAGVFWVAASLSDRIGQDSDKMYSILV